MYCKNCNKSFDDSNSFCDACGSKLESEVITEEPQPIEPAIIDAIEEEMQSESKLEMERIQPEPQFGAQPAPQSVQSEPGIVQPEPQPEVQPGPYVHQQSDQDYQAMQFASSATPIQTPSEPTEDKKQSKTISFGLWIVITLLNLVPFVVGVFYTIALIIGTIITASNDWSSLVPFGLILPLLALAYIVLLFVWAFGKPKARSLKNYAKATLLMSAIVVVLTLVGVFLAYDALIEIWENIVPLLEQQMQYNY